MKLSDSTLFLHPSDELYGADRILLEVISTIPQRSRVLLLPTDVSYPNRLLSRHLEGSGIPVRRANLPVLRRANLRIRHFPRLFIAFLAGVATLVRERAKTVYLSTSAMLLLAWPARVLGAKVILHVHEVWQPRERWLLGLLAMACTDVVCVSQASAQSLPRRLATDAKVIHNGIPAPQDPAPRSRTGIASPDLMFMVASRWNSWKGHETLLSAWQRVLNDGPNGRRLVILGGPPASGEVCDVPGLVHNLSFPATVEVAGEVDDVTGWLFECDCVIVPSILPDPLPTIAIEAAAAGKPVIASHTGGLPEIVADRQTGLLVPSGDPVALASAILSMDKESCHQMGAMAQSVYDAKFSPRRFRRAIQDVLGA